MLGCEVLNRDSASNSERQFAYKCVLIFDERCSAFEVEGHGSLLTYLFWLFTCLKSRAQGMVLADEGAYEDLDVR